MNDENDMAVNQSVGDEANLDTSPVSDQEAAEETIPSNTESTEEVDEQIGETAGEPKRGAQTRIRELNAAKKAAEARAQSLEERLSELTSIAGQQFSQGNLPDLNIGQGGEIDPAEFERRVLQQADARAELKIRQSEAINRINSEASTVMTLYPELNPDSDEYNAELSDAITESVEAYVRANPYTASVKKHVEKLMKPYKGAVEKRVGQASENIAKQVSQAALRPTSVHKQEKTANEKSIAELEDELGIVIS